MDITRVAVAATQFTAYTALMNLAITFSARWQGWAIERWGYPTTLLADVAVGFAILLVLPFLRHRRQAVRMPPAADTMGCRARSWPQPPSTSWPAERRSRV